MNEKSFHFPEQPRNAYNYYQEIFRLVDKDGNGKIDRSELLDFIADIFKTDLS